MHNIIELSEQKGYGKFEQYPDKLEDCPDMRNEIKILQRGNDCSCLSYKIKDGKLSYQTSYFIGLDWIVENKLAAYIRPKMDNGVYQVDYISMLMYALNNIDNHKHLTDLIHVQFERPHIEIDEQNDELSLFITVEYLYLLHKLVQGGLKRSYYIVEENLNSQIKGKILVGQNVKTNCAKGKMTKTCCQYQYYGYDSEENRILKKAFLFACKSVEQAHLKALSSLCPIIDYIRPAFEGVSNTIEISRIKSHKPNPLYPEYGECLRLALLLLRRYNYTITPSNGVQIVTTPPYWIDMSKLFELYVYQKLREQFPTEYIKYHQCMNYQELDILFSNGKDKYVIDAKYKPRYEEQHLSMNDVRQVCGYARMSKVYEQLKVNRKQIIPTMIIYPKLNGSIRFEKKDIETDDRYIGLYKYGIKLPEV